MSAAGLDALKQRFTSGLARRADALHDALHEAANGAEPVYDLMVQFHALAGIAGMYGLHEITGAARDAEIRCADAYDLRRPLDPAECRDLRAIIAGLRAYR